MGEIFVVQWFRDRYMYYCPAAGHPATKLTRFETLPMQEKKYISQIETTWHYDPSKNTFAAFSSRSLKCLLVNSIIYSFLSSLFKFSICLFIHSFIHSSHLFICIASFLSIFILSIHLLPSFIYLCISLPIWSIICSLNPLLLFNLLPLIIIMI